MSLRFAFRHPPDAERRGCSDCAHLVGYVSLWCGSPDARAAHGSGIPDYRACSFWAPAPLIADLSWWDRLTRRYEPVEAVDTP